MEEDQELQNPFPSPPSHYTNYTSHNLHLLSLLTARIGDLGEASAASGDEAIQKQRELLANEKYVPDWPLSQLEKPRVDWILEEGEYNAFGDTWFTKERIPTLAEMGGQQLYPEDPTVDRRPALQTVLRSLLQTYSSFLSSILSPPPPQSSDLPPDWQRLVEWMRVMGQNIMGAANDLRPVQARGNLEAMMTRQLELRRDETRAINAKCDALEAKLSELCMRATDLGTPLSSSSAHPIDNFFQKSATGDTDVDMLFDEPSELAKQSRPVEAATGPNTSESNHDDIQGITLAKVTEEDMLRWAEEMG